MPLIAGDVIVATPAEPESAPVDVEDGAAAGADKPKPERPKKEKAPMIRKDVRGNGNDKKKQKELAN